MFLAIVAGALLIRLILAVVTPAWQSPDEFPHYWVAQEIAQTGSLPVSFAEFPRYESYQPPLYYLAVSPLVKTIPSNVAYTEERVRPDQGLILLRLVSVAFGMLTLLVFWRMLVDMKFLSNGDRLAAFAVMAFLPTYAGVTSSLNNDAPAILFSTLSLRLALKSEMTGRTRIVCGIWAALALLTKINTMVILPFLAFRCWEIAGRRMGAAFRQALPVFIPVLCGIALLGLRNVLQYDSLTAINPGLRQGWDISAARILHAARNLLWSFWLAFGRTYRVTPAPVVYLVTAVPLMVLAGWGIARTWGKHHVWVTPMLSLIVLAIAASLVYTLQYPAGVMTSWGKNVYPVLSLCAIVIALGWRNAILTRPMLIPAIGACTLFLGCVWACVSVG